MISGSGITAEHTLLHSEVSTVDIYCAAVIGRVVRHRAIFHFEIGYLAFICGNIGCATVVVRGSISGERTVRHGEDTVLDVCCTTIICSGIAAERTLLHREVTRADTCSAAVFSGSVVAKRTIVHGEGTLVDKYRTATRGRGVFCHRSVPHHKLRIFAVDEYCAASVGRSIILSKFAGFHGEVTVLDVNRTAIVIGSILRNDTASHVKVTVVDVDRTTILCRVGFFAADRTAADGYFCILAHFISRYVNRTAISGRSFVSKDLTAGDLNIQIILGVCIRGSVDVYSAAVASRRLISADGTTIDVNVRVILSVCTAGIFSITGGLSNCNTPAVRRTVAGNNRAVVDVDRELLTI